MNHQLQKPSGSRLLAAFGVGVESLWVRVRVLMVGLLALGFGGWGVGFRV